jgi:hypothetical protein
VRINCFHIFMPISLISYILDGFLGQGEIRSLIQVWVTNPYIPLTFEIFSDLVIQSCKIDAWPYWWLNLHWYLAQVKFRDLFCALWYFEFRDLFCALWYFAKGFIVESMLVFPTIIFIKRVRFPYIYIISDL